MRINLDDFENIERDRSFGPAPRRRRRKKHRFFKFLSSLTLALVIVAIIAYATLKFFVGPIITTVDSLPSDFPSALSIYNLDSADINLQTPESREKIISGMRSMPDWVLTIFLNFLSDDLKGQLAENFGDEIDVDKDFSIDYLKETIKTVNLEKARTVNLSWDGIGATKEEMSAYYKQKLTEANFEFNESLKDYNINLGFWKDGIFGIMSFVDSKEKIDEDSGYNSDVDITVNYFDQIVNKDE